MELLIGISAQGRLIPWGQHQSHMTRTAVICVCGKTPSNQTAFITNRLSVACTVGAQLWDWEESWKEVELALYNVPNVFSFMFSFFHCCNSYKTSKQQQHRLRPGWTNCNCICCDQYHCQYLTATKYKIMIYWWYAVFLFFSCTCICNIFTDWLFMVEN